MITQFNLGKLLSLYAIILFVIFGLSGCGSGTDTSATSIPLTTSSIPTTTTLPTNLFDSTAGVNTVAGSTVPVTTATSGTSTPITYNQAQCLGNNNIFFNGLSPSSSTTTNPINSSLGSSNACYSSQFSPLDFFGAGLNTLGFAGTCLQAILAAQPTATDPNSVAYAFAVGAMAVSRCVAQMNQQQYNFPAQWNSWQQGVFGANNSGLFNSIQGFQPLNGFNGSSVYPGPGFYSGGYGSLSH